jgi:hypothetical protein
MKEAQAKSVMEFRGQFMFAQHCQAARKPGTLPGFTACCPSHGHFLNLENLQELTYNIIT